MRASRFWPWLVALAACTEHGRSPADAPIGSCPTNVASLVPCSPPPPALLVTETQMVDFGSIAVSTRSPVTAIRISNAGGSLSGQITPSLSGTEPDQFAVTDGCDTLDPLGTCTVTVTFAPTTEGTKTATLVVSSSPGGSIMVALTGIGTM